MGTRSSKSRRVAAVVRERMERGGERALRIPEALERLVPLHEAKGNAVEAAAWRSKLEAARLAESRPATAGEK